MKANILTSPTSSLSAASPSHENGISLSEPMAGPVHLEQQQQQQHAQQFQDDSFAGPDPRDIERTAYELYAENGYEEGHSLDHWLEAERRLRHAPLARVA